MQGNGKGGGIQPRAILLRDLPEPLFSGRFDLLAGNPPWVNWEHLPPAYRAVLQPLWPKLGLFDVRKGTERAFSKEDVSALVIYAACQRYLKECGRAGFLLPKSLFKSSLNGRGFRRFRLGVDGPELHVVRVDDFTEIRPFEGAINHAAAVLIERDRPTVFPVPYRKWSLPGRRKSVDGKMSWDEVKELVHIELLNAVPTDDRDNTSCWMTARPEAVALLARLSGSCPYRARTGVFTGGANGVFYLDVRQRGTDGTIVARNVTDRAKRLVAQREAILEPKYVFPLLRGRDVQFWKHTVSLAMLCPHTAQSGMHAVVPDDLRLDAPLTYAYLQGFRDVLLERGGFAGWERQYLAESFYACQRIGPYTFAPYKVVWRYICREFKCCTVGPLESPFLDERPVVPHEKLMLMGFQDEAEAYYVCGVLSTTPVRFFIESRMVETQIGPHVISRLALPPYDPENEAHRRIAAACREGHAFRSLNNDAQARKSLDAIDEWIVRVMPVTRDEVRSLRSLTSDPL